MVKHLAENERHGIEEESAQDGTGGPILFPQTAQTNGGNDNQDGKEYDSIEHIRGVPLKRCEVVTQVSPEGHWRTLWLASLIGTMTMTVTLRTSLSGASSEPRTLSLSCYLGSYILGSGRTSLDGFAMDCKGRADKTQHRQVDHSTESHSVPWAFCNVDYECVIVAMYISRQTYSAFQCTTPLGYRTRQPRHEGCRME
ncbi:hypothetical protein X943_001032 [Babesia divergens]|uniref:Uncharacterized protein n=1 Tax=Babesia divergens TaxID=32595 RepID=A0AAD9LK90_BABDI|nr:hypothetical protein X943_001032 [Babesia divergens]